MEEYVIMHYRGTDNNQEYIVITDSEAMPDDHELPGFEHHETIKIDGDRLYILPLDTPLFPH